MKASLHIQNGSLSGRKTFTWGGFVIASMYGNSMETFLNDAQLNQKRDDISDQRIVRKANKALF